MKGIWLVGRGGVPPYDDYIVSRARGAGVEVCQMSPMDKSGGTSGGLPFEKTLIVEAGTRVPWDLLPAAWHFLERWDVAVPMCTTLASQIGTEEQRRATCEVVRDLRVMLYAHELLFVRKNEVGEELLKVWGEECQVSPMDKSGGTSGEEGNRLAFLRAVYRVKPRLCVLPQTWLREPPAVGVDLAAKGRGRRPRRNPTPGPSPFSRAENGEGGGRSSTNGQRGLVRVEVAPGQFVKCREGDEGKVREMFERKR